MKLKKILLLLSAIGTTPYAFGATVYFANNYSSTMGEVLNFDEQIFQNMSKDLGTLSTKKMGTGTTSYLFLNSSSGEGSVLNINVSSTNNDWNLNDFNYTNCSVLNSVCTRFISSSSSNATDIPDYQAYGMVAYQGGVINIQSDILDKAQQPAITTDKYKLAIVYSNATETDGGLNNANQINLSNLNFTKTYMGVGTADRFVSDLLLGTLQTNPYNYKKANTPFIPNISIINSTITASTFASIVHSDMYVEDTSFTSYGDYTSLAACGTCSGITLIGRNARLVGKNMDITTFGNAISLVDGGSTSTAQKDYSFGSIDLYGGTLTTYKNGASTIAVSTGLIAGQTPIEKIKLDHVTIQNYSSGTTSGGVWASYSSGTILNSNIHTYNDKAVGVYLEMNGTYTLKNTTVTTGSTNASNEVVGDGAHGIYANTSAVAGTKEAVVGAVKLDLENVNVSTKGTGAMGIIAYGVGGASSDPFNKRYQTQLLLTGMITQDTYGVHSTSTLTTQGNGSHLLYVSNGANAQVSGVVGSTQGVASHALYINGRSTGPNGSYFYSTMNLDHAWLSTQNDSSVIAFLANGASLNANQLNATTHGQGAYTAYLASSVNGITQTLSLTNSKLTSEQSHGLVIRGGQQSNISLTNTSISTLAPSTATIPGYAIYATNYDIDVSSKDINLTMTQGSKLLGDVVLNADSDITTLSLDDSTLTGSVTIKDRSTFNTLSLNNHSVWQGTTTRTDLASAIQTASIDQTSVWTITDGLTAEVQRLSNAGTIRFDTVLVEQTLNVTGDYIGGGTIDMYGQYRSDDTDSDVDRLLISGNASGQTKIRFFSQDGIGAQTTANGITVVDVAGTSAVDSFVQEGTLVAGLYKYTLNARGDDTTGRVWYLSSVYQPKPPVDPPAPPVDPVEPPEPIKPPVPPEPIIPPELPDNYRPEVIVTSIIPSLAYSAGALQLATYQERLAGTDNNLDNKGAWFRYFNQQADIRYRTGHTDLDKSRSFEAQGAQYDRTVNGFQFGYDIYRDNNIKLDLFSAQAMKRSGVFFGVSKTESDVHDIYSDHTVGEVSMSNLAIGAYYTAQLDNGWYSDNIAGINFLYGIKSSYSDSSTPATRTHGISLMLSSELGYKHFLSADTFIEPQAQVSFQHINLNDLSIANDLSLRFGNTDALTTRLGVRLGQRLDQDPQSIAYLRLNVSSSYGSHADLHYSNPVIGAQTERQINNEMDGSWVHLDAGVNRRLSKQSYGYFAIDYAKGVDHSDGQQLNLKLGVATQF